MLFLLVQIKPLVLSSLKAGLYAVFQAFLLLLNLENMAFIKDRINDRLQSFHQRSHQ